MQLEHSFSVPAGIDTVWAAVLDLERVAPCMPGATLTKVDGLTFAGTVKVKLGPISLLYKGSGEFLEQDEQARRIVVKAAGKDSRGNGNASATVTVVFVADGPDRTTGTVDTDLAITGKPAQFGRGLISEVGGKLLDVFSACLAEKLADPAPAAEDSDRADDQPAVSAEGGATPAGTPLSGAGPVAAVPESPQARAPLSAVGSGNGSAPADSAKSDRAAAKATAPIDLMEFAGSSVAKRLIPVAVGALLVALVVALRRRG